MNKIYCKNCKYHYYNWAEALHRCKRNVIETLDPIGYRIIDRGERCFTVNANCDCKDFKQKRKWYQRNKITKR